MRQNLKTTEECERTVEVNDIVPYQFLSKKWYKRKGALSLKNISRNKQINNVDGSLNQSCQKLEDKNKKLVAGTKRYNENKAMIIVAINIKQHGPLVSTQEIGKVLSGTKYNAVRKSRKPRSSEILRRIRRHLNVVQFHIRGKAYIMENRNQNIFNIAI